MPRNHEDLDSYVVPPRERGGPYVGTPESIDRAILHFMLEELRATLRGCKALSVEDLVEIPLRVRRIVEQLVMDLEDKG